MVFPTYASISSWSRRVVWDRPRLPDRKVHPGGQLERPAGAVRGPELVQNCPGGHLGRPGSRAQNRCPSGSAAGCHPAPGSGRRRGVEVGPDSCGRACAPAPPPASATTSRARYSLRTRLCLLSCPGSSPACGAWRPSACPATCRAARFLCISDSCDMLTSGRNSSPRFTFRIRGMGMHGSGRS